MYVLTTAKLDAASHCWVTSLANYNFQWHYQAEKTKIDVDALLRVSWPGCVSDDSGTHLKVTAAVVKAVQEAPSKVQPVLLRPTAMICMFWMQFSTVSRSPAWPRRTGVKAQQEDPTLSPVISRFWDGTLGQKWFKPTDPPEYGQFLWECNHLLLKQGVLSRWARPRESEETLFQLVLPAAQREVALKGCHDEVGMCNQEPNCSDNSQDPMGQVHCPLWVAWENPVRPRS